jgi:ribokinase
VRTDEPTGEAIILVDGAGENVIVVSGGANLALTPDAVDRAAGGPRVVVTGFEVADAVVEAAARLAQTAGALLVLNPSPVRRLRPTMLAPRSLLVVNEGELVMLAAGAAATPHALAPASDALGGSDLVVTRGARGALAYDATTGETFDVAAPVVEAVDTSGCGDAFTGALVASLARGASLREAAENAADVGAFAATRRGTQSSYPTSAELADWRAARAAAAGPRVAAMPEGADQAL